MIISTDPHRNILFDLKNGFYIYEVIHAFGGKFRDFHIGHDQCPVKHGKVCIIQDNIILCGQCGKRCPTEDITTLNRAFAFLKSALNSE